MATRETTRRRPAAVLGVLAVVVAGWLVAGAGATVAPGPSPEAEMVCSAEAETDITGVLGVSLVSRPTATWAAPVYTCTYALSAGPMVLSVRELGDAAETSTYFDAAQRAATEPVSLPGLGEAAFSESTGNVLVRKDFKILLVDVTGLPEFFGQPRLARVAIGIQVGRIIMACWIGE